MASCGGSSCCYRSQSVVKDPSAFVQVSSALPVRCPCLPPSPIPMPVFSSSFLIPTHLWHSGSAAETSPDSIVDTLWLPPAWVDALEAVRLMAVEALGVLLDDRDVLLCLGHLGEN